MAEYNRTLYLVFKWVYKKWVYKGTFNSHAEAQYYIDLTDPDGVYDIEVRTSED